MMIHHTLKIVAMSPTENLISYPPKLDELSIVDFAVHNAIQLRSQLGITLFWGDNLVPKISFSVRHQSVDNAQYMAHLFLRV